MVIIMNRVVVTGLGAITPNGANVRETWEGIKKGVNGIAPITLIDTEGRKAKLAGEVKADLTQLLSRSEMRKMDRFTQLGVIAARECMADSGLTDFARERCGVIMSSGIGGMASTETEYKRGLEKGFDRISPFYIPMTIVNIAAGQIAIETGFKGYCGSPVTACAGGSYAIGDAFRQIRHGYLDVCMCGGSEASITDLGVGGFTSMKALNETDDITRASIPFDKERNGFIIGEGAGCLMLESLEHARARGARIYGEVLGFGASCDAHHITAPSPGGEGAAMAMQAALDDARLQADEIGYINAHGTSTPMNDKCEAAAIKAVFGGNKVFVSSTKSMTAHMLGAAGAVEGIICILAIGEGVLPPTINYRVPDEECDLNIIANTAVKAECKYAISNSLGFGGHNATIVFGGHHGA